MTAEIASVIAEGAFYHLDAPVRRLGAMDVPVPFSPVLEDLTVPTPELVAETARELCGKARRRPLDGHRSSCRRSASLRRPGGRAWLAVEGDTVTKGEPLFEIETDKVTVSIDAPASGSILSAVRADDGDEVPVGQGHRVHRRTGRNRRALAGQASAGARPSRSRRPHPRPTEAVPGCRVVLTRIRRPAPGITARAASGEGGWDRTRAGPRNRTGRSRDDGRPGRSDRGGCSHLASVAGLRHRNRGQSGPRSVPSGGGWPSA